MLLLQKGMRCTRYTGNDIFLSRVKEQVVYILSR